MKCPYCNKEAIYGENKMIYGKNYGKSYMVYYCKDCDAYVGCHQNTTKPLGTMANKELRNKRKETHLILDSKWRTKRERGICYSILKKYFGKEIHIGESNYEQCQKIIDFINSYNFNFDDSTNNTKTK